MAGWRSAESVHLAKDLCRRVRLLDEEQRRVAYAAGNVAKAQDAYLAVASLTDPEEIAWRSRELQELSDKLTHELGVLDRAESRLAALRQT